MPAEDVMGSHWACSPMTGAGFAGRRHKHLRGICFPAEPIGLPGRWKNSGPKGMNTVCTLTADIPGTIGKKRHPLTFFFIIISPCFCLPISLSAS